MLASSRADCNYFMEIMPGPGSLSGFEEKHPTNEATPYVMYQIAMCSYQQIDTIDRDTGSATRPSAIHQAQGLPSVTLR